MSKTLIAQFQSRCTACNCTINVGEEIVWRRGAGSRHSTTAACGAAKQRFIEKQKAEANTPSIEMAPIRDFLKAAQTRGLKRPRLRVLAEDGRTELRLSLTQRGVAPDSMAVVEGDVFIGCVRPDGHTTGLLATRQSLQKHLLRVAADPITAAREYAALTGLCSFCEQQLTDAGSVEVGYGPVCAKHWGLPHKPKGTPKLAPVPEGL